MSVLHLAAAAALVLAVPGSTSQTPDPLPPQVIIVQLCLSVTAPDVDRVLAGVGDEDLVGELAALAPVTVPDADGLVPAPGVDLVRLRAVLNCTIVVPGPTTTPAATTTPVPTTTPAPTTVPGSTTVPVPTAAPTATPDDEDEDDGTVQVRTVPVGGVATGDGSTVR